MKAIKYLLVGALLTGVAAPVMAQSDVNAQVDAITKAIEGNKSNPDAIKDQVKDFYKENKKNVKALVGLSRAYLNVSDTINAVKYAEEARKKAKEPADKAAAFIQLGDIAAFRNEGGEAAVWYQQAVNADPQNEDGYIKYARIYRVSSPQEAVSMLEKLRTVKPDYPVDAVSAHFFYQANDFDNALSYFDKTDKSKLDDGQLVEYALSAYFKGNFDKTIEVSTFGLQKYPREAGLNRLAFYGYTDKKDYDNALLYANKLFNESDSAKFTALDYTYSGYACMGKKDYDNAIKAFLKSLELNENRPDLIAGVQRQLSDAYLAKEDYDNAIKMYDAFLKNKKEPTASDYAGLATIYVNHASHMPKDQYVAELKKADTIYQQLVEKFPDAKEYSIFMRARLNSYMDPDSKQGLAKPFYEEIASLIEGHTAELTAADKARLVESYHYLISYYFNVKQQTEKAKEISHKLLKVAPNDTVAKQVIGL